MPRESRPAPSRSASKSPFSSSRRLWFSNPNSASSSASSRLQISAPSNFRHVSSGAYQTFAPAPSPGLPPPAVASIRAIPPELSIDWTETHISPILPHFGDLQDLITPPPAAALNQTTWDGSTSTLTQDRNRSPGSYHLPRRRSTFGSSSVSPESSPEASPSHHTRSSPLASSPSTAVPAVAVDRMKERIASALLERDRLQEEIDVLVERQSIYANSRPSTAQGRQSLSGIDYTRVFAKMEQVPSIPALPAAAPSFAARLSTESHCRSMTGLSQPALRSTHLRERPFASGPISNDVSPTSQFGSDELMDMPLAPPLPLVFRPPLRKKKSFSRVSNWLFPAGAEPTEYGSGSITNAPRPVTEKDGFYVPMGGARMSIDTVSSASTWESGEGQTVPTTTWSPGSSPAVHQDSMLKPSPIAFEMVGGASTRGRSVQGHRPTSVGVAI